jgi:hypothetical protein
MCYTEREPPKGDLNPKISFITPIILLNALFIPDTSNQTILIHLHIIVKTRFDCDARAHSSTIGSTWREGVDKSGRNSCMFWL